jgi:hypothetical protein
MLPLRTAGSTPEAPRGLKTWAAAALVCDGKRLVTGESAARELHPVYLSRGVLWESRWMLDVKI